MALRPEEILPLVVGTAGHIDHGKSSLVRALTGIDPDRLKEEQERGMTIDLGFAPLVLADGRRVGIIDVPGHEAFIKNMVAGATGIDCALLAVAADDGVMPQTREHLSIMQLLGIRAGVVAVTKSDAVEADLLELAALEVREFLKGSFLEGAEVVPVSAHTGAGLEALRAALERAFARVAPRAAFGAAFRMPIQRVFSAPGFGTVVTGVPLSGRIAQGDLVEILPRGLCGKVRGVQAYLEDLEAARAGHSTALNVADIDYKEVSRGDVACTPGEFCATRLVEATLDYLASMARPLAAHARVRFHAGTAEVMGEIVPLDRKEVAPGDRALCQVRLEADCAVVPGDRFILRRASPVETLGGGVVIGRSRARLRALKPQVVAALAAKAEAVASGSAEALAAAALAAAGARPALPAELAVEIGRPRAEVERALAALAARGVAARVGRHDRYVHADGLAAAKAVALRELAAFLAEGPMRRSMERLTLKARSHLADEAFDAAVEALHASGEIEVEEAGPGRPARVRPKGRDAALAPAQKALKERLEALHRDARLAPPSPEEALKQLGLPAKERASVEALLALLVEEGVLCPVGDGLRFHREALEAGRGELAAAFRERERWSASDLKDRLQTTRKYAIPLLELFDAEGWTAREGVERVWKGGASRP